MPIRSSLAVVALAAISTDIAAARPVPRPLGFELAQLYRAEAERAERHGQRAETVGVPSDASARSSAAAADAGQPAERQNTLRMIVALTWEGRDLRPDNLAAIDDFRRRFPGLRVAHFVSPAYFLRGDEQTAANAQVIRARVLPGDSVGLLLSGWRSVANAAGLAFRGDPTFWGATLQPTDCRVDCGLEVPVNVYPPKDLRRLISFGAETLARQGFGRPIALQTSGWVASPPVIEAAADEGMLYDFSAVPVAQVRDRLRHYPLLGWVTSLWQDVSTQTGPFELRAGDAQITEVPLTLGAIDYIDPQMALDTLGPWLTVAKRRGGSGRLPTVTLGLYQETGDIMRAMLVRVVQSVLTAAAKQRVTIESVVLPDLGAPAGDHPSIVDAPPPAASPPAPLESDVRLKDPPKVH